MMVSNLGFELLTQWRRWRGQYLKLAILLLGFALTAALLSIALRLGSMLFYENPSWTNTQKPLYTLGRLSEDNRLSAVSKQAIVQLKTLPMVEDVSWLVFKEFNFSIDNAKLSNVRSAIFSPNMADNLAIDELKNSKVSGAWITEKFWREKLKSDANIKGKILSYKRLEQGIPILGVLDKKYNQVGVNHIDVWLPEDILRYSTPFTNDSMVDRFLQAAPLYYAVFSAKMSFDPEQTKKQLESIDLSVKGMSFGRSPLPLVIFSGVNFDPKSHQHMVLLWQLLIGLIVTLFFILTFSLFSISSSKAIVFADEYKTLRLLGAQSSDFIRSALLFACLKIVVISLLSVLSLYLLSQLIISSASYQLLFTDKDLSVDSASFISAIAMIAVSVIVCALVPLVNLLKGSLFNRMANTRVSLFQKTLAGGILIIQLSVALTAAYALSHVAHTQWQQYHQSNIDLSVAQVRIDSGHFAISWRQALNQVQQLDPQAVILSSPFEKLHQYTLEDQRLKESLDIKTVYASSHFFDLLDADIQGKQLANWQNGVIINHALARHLTSSQELSSLIGTTINYGLENQQLTIAGISENIPHWGRKQSIMPTLYLPFNTYDEETLKNFSVLSNNINALSYNSDFTHWLNEQAASITIHKTETLADILAKFDQQSTDLLWFGFIITLIILVGIFSGIWYQVLAQLRLDKQSICVLLAIGATDGYVIFSRCKEILFAFMLAIIACFIFYKLIGSALLGFDLVALFIALLTTLALCLVATLSPLVKLLKTPIQQALREF
tara:strand:+ start:2914 stop:5253 length:2340 start_codon:yes stop_codon:yes gene_type:complete